MFYGWRIVGGSFVAQMFVVGFFTYSVSLLIPSLRAEFGVSLEQIMYGMTIGTLAGLILAPLVGMLVDRLPVRWLMALGSLIFGLGLLALARSQSITQYVWIFGLTMALANSLAATLPALTIVSRWFTVSRGKALGIAAVGTSVGGALIPALTSWWLELVGWRGTLEYMALAVLTVMLPITIVFVRGKPADVGLQAEHDPAASQLADEAALTAKEILTNPSYWSIAISLGLTMAAYSAILANITPYVRHTGHSDSSASMLIMTIAISGLIGKLVFGTGADKFNLKLGLWTAQALAIVAFVLFSLEPDFGLMLLAAALMGLAAGGLLPVWGALIARIFGLASYGLTMGLMSPLITLCIIPSFVLIGRLVDSYGSYQLPLLLFAATTAVAAVALLPLRIPLQLSKA